MFIIFIVFFAIATSICYSDDHIYGVENPGDKLLFEKVLFSRKLSQPKNYTLIFKYIGSEISPNITYAKFEVKNAISEGIIGVDTEKDKEKTLQAQLNIINGTDIYVNAQIFGPSVNLIDISTLQKIASIGSWDRAGDRNHPKTVTIVYGHNKTQTRNRRVDLGHRQSGDRLIDFQTNNVTYSYRFPEAELQFHDKTKFITSVGFSFDSPTAIAFINSTFLNENGINCIVYDMNSPFFVANMSVYGYDNFDKPDTYKSIVYKFPKK